MPSVGQFSAKSPSGLCFVKKCSFPLEILDEIAVCLLAAEPSFSSIANLSLTSYQVRQTALRCYFSVLYACSASHLERCCHIPGVFNWVRSLNAESRSLTPKPELLSHFADLRVIEVDFAADGLATQQTRTKILFMHIPATITEMRLTFLPRIDAKLLSLIASRLPHLETLDLTCADRLDEGCCWLCYKESSSCALHSPLPDMHSTVEDLATSFANALKPLKKLEHLFLGVLLSDIDLIHEHILHRDQLDVSMFERPILSAPDRCPICVDKYSTIVRKRELVASATMAKTLTTLQTISWSTFFAESQPGDDSEARVTTMWIRRAKGRIQVKRASW